MTSRRTSPTKEAQARNNPSSAAFRPTRVFRQIATNNSCATSSPNNVVSQHSHVVKSCASSRQNYDAYSEAPTEPSKSQNGKMPNGRGQATAQSYVANMPKFQEQAETAQLQNTEDKTVTCNGACKHTHSRDSYISCPGVIKPTTEPIAPSEPPEPPRVQAHQSTEHCTGNAQASLIQRLQSSHGLKQLNTPKNASLQSLT